VDLTLVVGLAVTATLLAVTCVLLAFAVAGGRAARRALAASRAETERLAARLEQVERARQAHPPAIPEEYLITNVGSAPEDDADDEGARTSLVLSTALAEPLVKALAFGYGVRTALSPQNRNRIRFEMRRTVRQARKRRRRTAREAAREAARQSARQAAA
jgi:hypothetical protein